MLTVLVRSKRDRDALLAAINKFYSEWGLRVETLHGARTAGKIADRIDELLSEDKNRFYLLLLGLEDKDAVKELVDEYDLAPNIAIHMVPRAKVRNARIEQLANEVLRGRSLFRLAASWNENLGVYIFGLWRGIDLTRVYGYEPAYDVFLGLGKVTRRIIEEIIGSRIAYPPLIVRKLGGRHELYNASKLVAVIEVPDEGVKPRGMLLDENIGQDIPLEKLLAYNRDVVGLYEEISLRFLREEASKYDTIIVPWSGGKDSTATLLLTLKAASRKKVKALFVDTGTEFPETMEYVNEVGKKLGVEVHRVRAKVLEGIVEERLPLPTHDARWCTGRKIDAIRRGVAEIAEGKTLVVVGDREAESRRRSRRPPTRMDVEGGYTTIAPLKLWGTSHVQLYLLLNNIRLNPLYEMGFYRIGCYMCPALRSWELYVLLRSRSTYLRLVKSSVFREFMFKRLFRPPKSRS